MTTQAPLELTFQGQQRNDMLMPLLQGRSTAEGVVIRPTPGPVDYFSDPRYRNGEFGILDANWGDIIPTIDQGWDVKCLPVFTKRKLAYTYVWVRADRGINGPKDLEGKTFATGFYEGAVATFTRGFLHHFHGVDLAKLKWLVTTPKRFDVYNTRVQVEYASGPRKGHVDRLLDGEVDACTSDITASKDWAALESNPNVKRLFPNYQELNLQLYREHRICTPVHLILMGGKTYRDHPGLARRVYDAFDRSRALAYEDLLGDQPGLSGNLYSREAMRDQMREWGDVWKGGITANRNTIAAFLDYTYEHGVTQKRLTLDQVFAADTLDT